MQFNCIIHIYFYDTIKAFIMTYFMSHAFIEDIITNTDMCGLNYGC